MQSASKNSIFEKLCRALCNIDKSIVRVVAATTTKDRHRFSQELGVAIRGRSTNHSRERAGIDTVFRVPSGDFHQGKLVSTMTRKIIGGIFA